MFKHQHSILGTYTVLSRLFIIKVASIIVFLRKAFREFVIACYLDIILYIMFLRLAAC